MERLVEAAAQKLVDRGLYFHAHFASLVVPEHVSQLLTDFLYLEQTLDTFGDSRDNLFFLLQAVIDLLETFADTVELGQHIIDTVQDFVGGQPSGAGGLVRLLNHLGHFR